MQGAESVVWKEGHAPLLTYIFKGYIDKNLVGSQSSVHAHREPGWGACQNADTQYSCPKITIQSIQEVA